ncbi:Mitochondrial Carrier (MC) Family [Achlya hypogyna]|uniref:Mitochondrial Carrier (MC) Family n=1 Tax=Achlya hypogyna TaxID=1202772 RepID=A0A1V9YJG1_ACHHY|nr:Mitochondrial Carrier (MC) Family [Achlya hypogyna]
MQKDSLYTRFLAGAVASSTAEMATLPVDITKVRLQAQGMTAHQSVQYAGMADAMAKIARLEGPSALWKGARPAVTRQIVYSSMCMVLYEPFRDAIMLMGEPKSAQHAPSSMSFAQKLMAGGLAGAISISIANPVDVIKVRMQADRSGALYSGLIDAVRKIHAAEGGRGFLSGLGPNVTRGFIVNAAELGVYDQCKSTLISLGLVQEGSLGATFGSSLVAGLAGALASNPVDVVKTRLMTQPAGSAALYRSAHHCAFKTVSDEGLRAFYKGFLPNWMRKAPWCVVFFVTYEHAKGALVVPAATPLVPTPARAKVVVASSQE